MTDLVAKYKLGDAIERLKKRYPGCMNNHKSLDEVVPMFDPDFVIIRTFRNEVKYNDRFNLNNKKVIQRIHTMVKNGYSTQSIAKDVGTSAKEVSRIISSDPTLAGMYRSKRDTYRQVMVLDAWNGKLKNFASPVQAAKYMGMSVNSLYFYLKERKMPYLIHKRYRVKRKLWFVEDNGM